MESAPKGCGGVGHRRVRAGQRGPPRRGAQGTPRGWRMQVWGTHSQDVCTEAGSNLDKWDTSVRAGHVHEQRDRSITKACSGPGTQSSRACMAPTDRAQSAAGVGEQLVTSPPRPLLRSGLCHQSHQPACLLQAPSPLFRPSLKTPVLTQFPAQNHRSPWPKGQIARSRELRPLSDARLQLAVRRVPALSLARLPG